MSEILLSIKIDTPYIPNSVLLKRFYLSDKTLRRWRTDWVSKGGALEDMGCFQISQCRELMWEPVKFLNWLINNKIKANVKYDYEAKDKKEASDNLMFFVRNNSQKIEGGNYYDNEAK